MPYITRNRVLIALAALAAAGALAWAFAPRPIQVEVATVDRGLFEQSIEEDGRTRLKDRYAISAPVAARLVRITLREGDRVAAGDVVATLTPAMPSLFDERGTREAAARLRAAQAGVAVAQARVARTQVAREDAAHELQRNARLAQDGFVASARLDSVQLALDAAGRELEAAQAQRDMAVHERAQAAAALQPSSGAAGQPLAVRSPVTGVVLRVPLQSEVSVVAGAVLLEVGDPQRMEVVAQLLTADAVQARAGTRAVIDRWGGPPVEGRVQRVEPAAFTKVSALGVEEQRVNVLIDVPEVPPAWHSMGDGFRVYARVIVGSTPQALLIPVGAVFPHGDGGMAVYRVEGSRARLQPVELEGRNAAVASVRSGLQPGQSVIVYPPSNVGDGKRLAVRRP